MQAVPVAPVPGRPAGVGWRDAELRAADDPLGLHRGVKTFAQFGDGPLKRSDASHCLFVQ
jgi:hypothetical protein